MEKSQVPQLETITQETLEALQKMPVVLPSLYRDTFNAYAQQGGVDFEDDGEKNSKMLIEGILEAANTAREASDHIRAKTAEARDAIQRKDDKALEKIDSEMGELQSKLQEMEQALHTDVLTKTKNRRWLSEEFLQKGRFQAAGAIGMINLNRFKQINKDHGVLAGDKVLAFVAQLLMTVQEVAVVRYTGDIFLLLWDHGDIQRLGDKVLKLELALAKKKMKIRDSNFKVTFSFGVERYGQGESFGKVLEAVDKVLQTQRKQARGR